MKTTDNREHPYTGAVFNGFAMLVFMFIILALGIFSIVACESAILPYWFGSTASNASSPTATPTSIWCSPAPKKAPRTAEIYL